MASSDFDKKIHAEFDNYFDTNVPAELQWSAVGEHIQSALNKRRKKRRILFWWWSGLGVFVLVVTAALLSRSMKTPTELGNFPISYPSSEENDSIIHYSISTHEKSIQNIVNQHTTSDTRASNKENLSIAAKELLPNVAAVKEQSKALGEENVSDNLPVSLSTEMVREALISAELLPILPPTNIPFIHQTETPVKLEEQTITPSKRKNWELQLLSGTNQLFMIKNNRATQYLDPISGWQASLNIQRKLKNNWQVQVGAQYERIWTRFRFTNERAALLYRPNSIDTIFQNTFTGEETVVRTDSVAGIIRQNIQQHNRFTSLQIPILLGYQITSQRWKIAGFSGVIFGFQQQSNGLFTVDEQKVIDLEKVTVYRKGLQIQLPLKLELAYQMNENWWLLSTVQIEKSLTNWIDIDLWQSEYHPVLYQFNIGIGFSF